MWPASAAYRRYFGFGAGLELGLAAPPGSSALTRVTFAFAAMERAGIVALVGLALGLITVATSASGSPIASRLSVYFLQGEQLRAVERPGSTAEDGLREL